MPEQVVRSPEELLRTYFHAKDENRPHLIRRAFCDSAVLEMNVRTDEVSFPPVTRGVDAIADVVASRFGQTFENVYSFYMQRPAAGVTRFSCDWLVGMSEKANGNVRVGSGRYDWSFQREAPHRVERFVITIEAMPVLPPSQLSSVMDWLSTLPYPWCSPGAVRAAFPGIAALEPVLRYLDRNAPHA